MRRRDFITCLGLAFVWPGRARAQANRVRRIGVLLPYGENDPEAKSHLSALTQELKRLGWSQDRNIRFDVRYGAGMADQYRALAKELAALQPDVFLSESTAAAAALKQETGTIPIVFVGVSDPVGSGFVTSLARPGGDLTGMMQYESGILGKWLSMLKEVAPHLTRCRIRRQSKIQRVRLLLAICPGGGARTCNRTCPNSDQQRYRRC
jgi:putative tryptophan/tyrosine transport system substrate-binding protein